MTRILSVCLVAVFTIAVPAFPQDQNGNARPFDSAQAKPIVVQGAMQIEVEKLADRLRGLPADPSADMNLTAYVGPATP